MTTTELTPVACHEVLASQPAQVHAEHAYLRMSWVVVTEKNGARTLRSRWSVMDEVHNK